MANSARPQSSPETFDEAVARALDADWRADSRTGVAVALSGGADSSLLLHCAARVARQHHTRLYAFHVNHGISPNAADWQTHCADFANACGVEFAARELDLTESRAASLEAQARAGRYDALADMAREHDVGLLLMGHNADDQAETVLINMLRGAGIAGVAAMSEARGHGAWTVARPLLPFSSASIRAAARSLGITPIEDESNGDPRYTRNALRSLVMPALREIFPDALNKIARTAQLASQSQVVLDEVGLADLGSDSTADGFKVRRLRELSPERAANALRAWFRRYRPHAPSHAALTEMLAQLRTARVAAHLEIEHEGELFGVENGRFTPRGSAVELPQSPLELNWRGEATLDVPEWHGRLAFREVQAPGIRVELLREGVLTLRMRAGGERLKLDPNRPSRTLKNLYQESGIPERERPRLPLLFANDQLVWAAGLGADIRACAGSGETGSIQLSWQSV